MYRHVPCLTGPPEACVPREGEVFVIPASDDAYISSEDEQRGFNNEAILIEDAPKMDGLIKWNLTEVICECVTIKSVKLRLYVVDPAPQGGFVHVMNPTWEEDSITWANAPESSGPPLVNRQGSKRDMDRVRCHRLGC